MPDADREAVDALLEQLEAAGQRQTPRPLADNPLLWGNYCVAYTSTSRAQSERGQPAGGRFRGRLGRTLFKTTGVYQSVLQPDVATNKVRVRTGATQHCQQCSPRCMSTPGAAWHDLKPHPLWPLRCRWAGFVQAVWAAAGRRGPAGQGASRGGGAATRHRHSRGPRHRARAV